MKRKDVFKYLREKNFSIYCLQDTHFENKDYNFIRAQWGYEVYLSGGTSDSRGIAILFNNNFEFKILKERADGEGNFLILEIEIAKKISLTLVSIYGPNQDRPDFYQNLSKQIDGFDTDFIMLCGDWNLVQDINLDYYNYVNINNPKAREEVLKIKEIYKLQDPWRIINPTSKKYTWFRRNPVKKARLDFFLISEELMTLVNKVNISTGYKTDHSVIELVLKISDLSKGKGFWKFNNQLLKNVEYVTKVKETISQTKKKYAALPYLPNAIDEIPDTNLELLISDQQFLDMLFLDIRGMTIPFSAKIKRERKETENSLQRQINLLEDLNNNTNSSLISDLLADTKRELEKLREENLRGSMVRSKANWVEHGEKPTKYFCALEKRNFVNKTLSQVIDNGGERITQQKDILKEVKNFYYNLYKSRDETLIDINLKNQLESYEVPKLNNRERETLEGEITYTETLETLKKMKNDKSPGSDGFTTEFIKFFWIDMGAFLVRSFNDGLARNKLSITQRQGVITILPKGDKPREYLKNWRPISLLNVSYKLLSGCIANRLKTVLDKLIHENQKGFLKGRYIGENTRLVYDILQSTEELNIPGVLLLIDFEKAFDSVSWKFLYQVMDYFNFSQCFIDYIKTLNNDINLCVLQSGFFSEFFTTGRGCMC